LYALPSRAALSFSDVLHLIKAGDSIADVRGILQRLLALLWESELHHAHRVSSIAISRDMSEGTIVVAVRSCVGVL
jgi:hypothetical protein